MRTNDTYRGVIRNFFRTRSERGGVGFSEAMELVQRGWRYANERANIRGRIEQTRQSIETFRNAFGISAAKWGNGGRLSLFMKEATLAQLQFWKGEKQSRAVSRIIRDLEGAVASSRA